MTKRYVASAWALAWVCLNLLLLAFSATAAEDNKALRVAPDQFGPVYHVDMKKVTSAADLTAIPGIKLAWGGKRQNINY